MQKKYLGQSLVDVCVITALVALGSMGAIYLFGDKMRSFFGNDSAVTKTADAGTTEMNSSSSVDFTSDYTKTIALTSSPSTEEKTYINIKSDSYLADYNITDYSYDEIADGRIPTEAEILAAQAAARAAAERAAAETAARAAAEAAAIAASSSSTSTIPSSSSSSSTSSSSTSSSTTTSSSGCDTACLVARAEAATAAAKAAREDVKSGDAERGSAKDERAAAKEARREAREACAADPTNPACT